MVERVGLTVKKPEVNRDNLDSRMRRTNHSRSVNPSVDRILFLQKTVGNQAVQRLMRSGALQAKLRIGQPGDVYEQEVDQVAEPSRVWDGAIGDQMRAIRGLPSAQFVFDLIAGRAVLICQTVLIGAGALAEAMINEASRQFNSWLA